MARRLMIVTYWYPPSIGAAAERVYSFARHLPRHGWEVDLVTAQVDCPELPHVRVFSVPDPLSGREPLFADYDPRRLAGGFGRMLRDVVFPDRFSQWASLAYREGLAAPCPPRPDVILATFPPASAVRLALKFQRRMRCPLVLDFRDRWMGPGGYEPQGLVARHRHERLEKSAIKNAAALIAVSDSMGEALALDHGISPKRVIVIPNGFEEDGINSEVPLKPIEDPPPTDKRLLNIAHVGTVIARNRPDLFLESLRRLHVAGRINDTVFTFVGNLSGNYVQSLGLDAVVKSTGLLPRSDARRLARGADGLLLLTGDYVGRWGYSAKLFEYLGVGRPILCVEETSGSNDRELLERLAPDRCFFARMNESDELAAQIEKVRAFVARHPRPLAPPAGLESFTRKTLAAELSARLAEVLGM